jgi:hypothetical protein
LARSQGSAGHAVVGPLVQGAGIAVGAVGDLHPAVVGAAAGLVFERVVIAVALCGHEVRWMLADVGEPAIDGRTEGDRRILIEKGDRGIGLGTGDTRDVQVGTALAVERGE